MKKLLLRDRNSLTFKNSCQAKVAIRFNVLENEEQQGENATSVALPRTIQKTIKFPNMATTSMMLKIAVQKKSGMGPIV